MPNWIAIKCILQYLAGTTHHGIYISYCVNLSAFVYCDVDWGMDKAYRKSTTSFMVFLRPNLISWSSRKQ